MEAPRQLPAGPRQFVNRDAELAALRRTLDEPRSVGITVLSGLPGVGKTALALKALERRRFPGGELLVEFGGELSVADALASTLRALGVADAVLPARLADRVGLYRTRTAERPVLVVLDDVSDPAQVGPLVPTAPGSVVLVTSTARLGELRLDGADIVDVPPLDEAAGAALLRGLVGPRAEDAAVGALVRACGGLPVLLRAVAARLLARRSLTVADLVAEIGDFAGAHDAALSVVYRGLPDALARLYRLLGVLPGADFAAELIECAAPGADVDHLVEVGLVQDGADGRYRLHTLVARHARDRALAEETAADRVAVVRRAVEYLLVGAAYADLAVLGEGRYRVWPRHLLDGHADPFGRDKTRALGWLDAERGTLAASVRAAAEHGWHDLVWQLAEAATALYVSRRYLVDWTETSALGADAAGLLGHADAEARLRSFASRAWTDLGDLQRARIELDAAFSLAGNSSDARLVASMYEMDGRWQDAAGDRVAAVAAFGRAVALFDSVGDRRGVAFVSYFLGCAQTGESALATLTDALERIRAVGDSRMAGRALISIADVLVASGDDVRAEATLVDAVSVLAGAEPFHEARAQEALAALAMRAGLREKARDRLRRARDLHTALGSGRIGELERRLVELTDP